MPDETDMHQDMLSAYQLVQNDLFDTEKRLEEALSAKEDILRKWKAAAGEFNRLMRTTQVHMTDNHALISSFRMLQYSIGNWCSNHFDGDLEADGKLLKVSPELYHIIQEPAAYLNSSYWRPRLIQSLLWLHLVREIFESQNEGKGLLWAGAMSESTRQVMNLLDPERSSKHQPSEKELQDYHYWRALTSMMVADKIPPKAVEERAKGSAEMFRGMVEDYFTTEDSTDELCQIVLQAVKLDAEMHAQRPHLTVQIPRDDTGHLYGYLADPDRDEWAWKGDPASTGAKRVFLCSMPRLVKRGTGYGDLYDQVLILVPATVHTYEFEADIDVEKGLRFQPSEMGRRKQVDRRGHSPRPRHVKVEKGSRRLKPLPVDDDHGCFGIRKLWSKSPRI